MTDSINDTRLVERGLYRQDDSAFIDSFPEPPRDTRVLHVDYIYSPSERLELWEKQNSDLIKEITFLCIGYNIKDGKTYTSKEISSSKITQTRISNPDDVQGIGIEITKFLTHTDDRTYPEIIFLDSISVMLQYVSLDTLVRFIQECLTTLDRCDAGGRFYFTPAAHDRETVNVIESLFK